MRDGVVLRAVVMKPAGAGPFPVLVYRTPYGAAAAVRTYSTFERAVERGYAVVAQDVRGRYDSDGTFDPYRQEGRDGYDTIEWAAAQPWSTGAVGTFGLSYPGAVQWLAAIEQPPHLRAMVPAMTFSRPTNFWYAGGMPDLSWPAWIWHNISADVRRRNGLAGPTTREEIRRLWDQHGDDWVNRLPLTNLPEFREISPWYFEWLAHPPTDPWWHWADLTDKYDRVSAAVLNLSGWHDDNYGPEGALTNFLGLASARGGHDGRNRLVLGPWVHGVSGINDRTARAAAGERIMGPRAGLDYDELILRFMDRHVRGLDNGADRDPVVRAFLMGENTWRDAPSWDALGAEPLRLDFGAGPTGRGTLRPEPAPRGRRMIDSDPDRPLVDPFAGRAGAHDYRALAERDDLLVFETEPFDEPLRVVGNITVHLTLSVDAPDTDIWVRLHDVAPDGTAWNLMSPGLDGIRVSHALGRLPGAGEPVRVILRDPLTGNTFGRGHRLRAVVSTSFMPYFGRNLHTGRSELVSAERRKARVTLHFGPDHESFLVLPVIR